MSAELRPIHDRSRRAYLSDTEAMRVESDGVVEVPLSSGIYALVDKRDFERVAEYSWHAHNSGSRNVIYADNDVVGRMHRFILEASDEFEVDHVNGNGLDNRRVNLRLASRSQNAVNRPKNANNTSGFRGVTWSERPPKWVAQIGFHSKHIHIGYFANREDAARAYDMKALELFGEFARLNFPETSDVAE